MSGYVEVYVKPDRRAFIEAGSVAGIIMPKGASGDFNATDDESLTVILKGGETLPGVFGISADELVFRCDGVREILRKTERLTAVIYLDRRDEFYAELAQVMESRHGRAA